MQMQEAIVQHPDYQLMQEAGDNLDRLVWRHPNGRYYSIIAVSQNEAGEPRVIHKNLHTGTVYDRTVENFFGKHDSGGFRFRVDQSDAVVTCAAKRQTVAFLMTEGNIQWVAKTPFGRDGYAMPLSVDLLGGDINSSPAVSYHVALFESWTRRADELKLELEGISNAPEDAEAYERTRSLWESALNHSAEHFDYANDMRRMGMGDAPVNCTFSNAVDLNDRVQKSVAGALFDFLGDLTTRDGTLKLGCTHEATPAIRCLEEWAQKRGLFLDNADVSNWSTNVAAAQNAKLVTYQVRTKGTTEEWTTVERQVYEISGNAPDQIERRILSNGEVIPSA